jgi:polar amino acid transport system substrate-binding protein
MSSSPLPCLLTAAAALLALGSTMPAQSARAAGAPIVAAVVPNYPPLEFKDPSSGQLTGFDIELGEALAAHAGTTIRWQETSFAQMLSALSTGRVNIILSGMSDLPERRDAVWFVDYLKTGPRFYALKERAAALVSMSALCGRKVGASRRTSFPAEISQWSADYCLRQGKPAIIVLGTEGSADARMQLRQGRLDAAVQGSETLGYLMSQEPNTYQAIGTTFAFQFDGIAIDRNNQSMRQEISDSMSALIADGSYARIAAKWGMNEFVVKQLTIDGKGSAGQ